FGERLLGIRDRRQLLVVDEHEGGGVAGDVGIGGDDGRHLLALVSDLVRGEHRLGVTGESGHPSQTVGGERFARHHRHHTFHRLGGGGVYRADTGMGNRGADDRHVEHAREDDVVEVPTRPLDESVVLLASHRVAQTPDFGGGGGAGSRGRHACASSMSSRAATLSAAPRSSPMASPARPAPASLIASTMFIYPVQRQRFPLISQRISSSVGVGFLSNSAAPTSIIPGVQNPHCKPWCSLKATWMGCRFPFWRKPSTVLISEPWACTARIVQDFTGLPSRITVQAPHEVVSHPMWVPVKPRWVRMKSTRRVRGSTSAERDSPLIVTSTC